jgi:hypothetical protein
MAMLEPKDQVSGKLYEIDYPAVVLKLIYDGYAYTLLRPLEVKLMELGVRGAKLKAAGNALPEGGQFEMGFEINGASRFILAEVLEVSSDGAGGSEYACRLCSNTIPMERVAL